MQNLSFELTPAMLVLVPIVASIVQILKRAKVLSKLKNWIPFLAIGVSAAICYASNIPEPIMPSIVIGLMASGSYDLIKKPKLPD